MTKPSYLTNHFLIAMPALQDPNFYHSVTYICEHNENGAMGLVINRPMEVGLGEILVHMDVEASTENIATTPVLLGGPVQQDRGFVLHNPPGEWDSMLSITDEIGMTSSRDIMQAIAKNEGPKQNLVILGYAGWAPGQLEEEIMNNAWLSGIADSEIIFELPYDQRWKAAASHMGVDLEKLSDDIGHA